MRPAAPNSGAKPRLHNALFIIYIISTQQAFHSIFNSKAFRFEIGIKNRMKKR
jgi:hypothetical protein